MNQIENISNFSKKTKILINAFKLADVETVIGVCMNLRWQKLKSI